MSEPELSDLRAQVDAVDTALVRLIEQRAHLVAEIAALKAAHATPLLDPERERAIVARAAASTSLPGAAVRAAFTGILEACKQALPPIQSEEAR